MLTPIKLITTSELYILLVLLKGEKHGYEIMQQVHEDSGDTLRLGPGTLYGTLKRMLEETWIEEVEKEDNPRRRYYKITRKGRGVVSAEMERYTHLLKLAKGWI